MKALLLATALAVASPHSAAPPASDAELSQRMWAGRIGAGVAFAGAVGGLAWALRALGRRAQSQEEEERLERAFREIDDELEKRGRGSARDPEEGDP